MHPLGKDQSISCLQEPLTFVRLGRVCVERTEEIQEQQISGYRVVVPTTNPRITGILIDNNVPVLSSISPHTQGLTLTRGERPNIATVHPWNSKMTINSTRICRQGNDKVSPVGL